MGEGLPNALLCPRCVVGLHDEQVGKVSINMCPRCGGHWYDAGELSQIKAERSKLIAEEKAAMDRLESQQGQVMQDLPTEREALRNQCPRCGVKLAPYHYAYSTEIIIDRCPECEGLWLDPGELDQIDHLVAGWESKLKEDERQSDGLLGRTHHHVPTDGKPRRGFLRGMLWNLFHHDE